MPLDEAQRRLFDRTLEDVLSGLPRTAREVLQTVPVIVEDRPDQTEVEEPGLEGSELLGLYTGIPATVRSIEHVGEPSDVIHLFRESLLAVATDAEGRVDDNLLFEEIRLTVLHEIGHHFGLSDEWLDDLGY